MKPSKKTIVAYDRAYYRYLHGDIDGKKFLHYCHSLWCLYDCDDIFRGQDELRKMRKRKYRWKKYLREMQFPLFLVTLTFSDDELAKKCKRKYVTECLSFFDDYFACADFGKKNGRLHYHAICSLVYDYGKWPYPLHYSKKSRRVSYGFNGFEWRGGWFSAYRIDSAEGRTFNYAFKSASYAFKCASDRGDIRPFHKRGVKFMTCTTEEDFDELRDYLEKGGNL